MLRLTNVEKRFETGATTVRVLRGIDLVLERGEFVVFLGPSGSGKSTLLNLVGGIDRATSGTVAFEGTDLGALEDDALSTYRRRHVGFVFQFYNLVSTLTALENVQVAAELVDDPRDPLETLGAVGLADRVDHFPAQLSGGEQQRVAIARGIVKSPDLLLCDEPTGALDAETGRRVLGILRDTASNGDTAVIVVTHNAAIAAIADRIIHLADGRIASDDRNDVLVSPAEIAW